MIFKFGRPHMVKPVLTSVNWNLTAKLQEAHFRSQYSAFQLIRACLEENLLNFVQEIAE